MFEILPNILDYEPYKGKFIRRIKKSSFLLNVKNSESFLVPDERAVTDFRAIASYYKISLKTEKFPNGCYRITKVEKKESWWESRVKDLQL